MIRPYQDRAYERFGRHTFQMSDEFYLDAGIDPPEADFYDGYPQYYDGIGMIRSYLDETDDVLATDAERLARVREAIAARSQHLLCLSGASARHRGALCGVAAWSRRHCHGHQEPLLRRQRGRDRPHRRV